jgi:DNA-directed RNA polymerase subunit M/transcription elongation factor TFIIS
MEDVREIGKKALNTVLTKEQNITIIENNIYKNCDNDETKYKTILYQIIGDVLNNIKLSDILKNIKENKIEWEHNEYKDISNYLKEQDEFLENPFQIEEGIFECTKCNSKKVFSYSKQSRSCDEATTIYCQCSNCKQKWIANS